MAKAKKEWTTDRWKDSLGQEFRPGDLVAVATINGKSPQMVVAEVVRINTHNSKGQRHTKQAWTGEMHSTERENKTYIGPEIPPDPTWEYRRDPYGSPYRTRAESVAAWQEWHQEKARLEADPENWVVRPPTIFWHETTEEVQTVTVTARPLVDGRGFCRSGNFRRGTDKEPPPHADNKPVTYMFVGNIIRLPDHITKDEVLAISRRPVEYPPSWGW